MAFEFLKPILTPNALATIQANPVLLAYFFGWIAVMFLIILGAWYIHFTTNKVYKKPKDPEAQNAFARTVKKISGGRIKG